MVFLRVGALIDGRYLEGAVLGQAAQRGEALGFVHVVAHCMVPLVRNHLLGAALHVAHPPVVIKTDVVALHQCAHHGICAAQPSVTVTRRLPDHEVDSHEKCSENESHTQMSLVQNS